MKDKALIVSIKIRQWSGRKFDRKITSEVNQNHGTNDAGRFNKILVDKGEISKINKIGNSVRAFVYHNTLPWGDNGDRLLPASNYFAFMQGLKPLKDEFDQATNDFCANYQALVDDAENTLNGLFNRLDYPSFAEIQDKFEIKVGLTPLPDAEDFRFELVSDAEIDKIREEIGVELGGRHKAAMSSLMKRCKDALSSAVGAVTRLNSKDGSNRFHSSLMDNIKELVDIIPSLNYANDPDIERLRLAMKKMITDPSTLKSSPELRESYLDRAAHLENMFF